MTDTKTPAPQNNVAREDACPACGGSGHYGDAARRAFDGETHAAARQPSREAFEGSIDTDTPLQAAAREAGWALTTLVDISDWQRRDQLSDIIGRLAAALLDGAVPAPQTTKPIGYIPSAFVQHLRDGVQGKIFIYAEPQPLTVALYVGPPPSHEAPDYSEAASGYNSPPHLIAEDTPPQISTERRDA